MHTIIILALSSSLLIVGVFTLLYQLYTLTVLDAQTRGISHPKFWGLLASGGNNSSGLFLYLLKRRNYPILKTSNDKKRKIEIKKKGCALSLAFIAIGTIGLVICSTLLPLL